MSDCQKFDELLLDGTAEAMSEAERHAQTCADCAASLDSWKEISSVAVSLHEEWQSDLLWRRIEKSIASEQRRPIRRLWQAAAAAILCVVLGGTMFYTLRVQNRNAAFDREILRVSAIDEVERTEAAHIAAIKQLEKVAEPKLDAADTPLMVSYKEKLMMLDDAIAECESAIEQNRQNAHLRTQLLAIYSEKQSTLREVLREDSHETTR